MSVQNPLSKNQKTSIIVLVVLLVLTEVFTGILGELMPDDFKNNIEKWVGEENYKIVWLCLLIAFVAALIWLTMKKDFGESNEKIEYSDELRTKVINTHLDIYKERLTQKLDDRIKLNLELKFTKQGTEETYIDKYFDDDAKSEKDLREKLALTLNKYKFLLIVGEPGAGKTTLLLDLAIELLENSLENQKSTIPIILNLASWKESYKNFGEWMIEVLVQGNGFSRAFAKQMIAENRILPLLDGLDELGSDSTNQDYQKKLRSACLKSLENYIYEKNIESFAICSRIDEYAQIEENAPVNAEILVKTLELEQVLQILEQSKNDTSTKNSFANPTAAINLLSLIQENEAIRKIVCIPFYFNTLVQILGKRKKYDFPDDEINLKEFVISEFISEKLTIKNGLYENKNILKWTSWWAKKLNEFGISNFELYTFDQYFFRDKFPLVVLTFLFGMFLFVANTLNPEPLWGNIYFKLSVIIINLFIFYFYLSKLKPINKLKLDFGSTSNIFGSLFIMMLFFMPKILNPNSTTFGQIFAAIYVTFLVSFVKNTPLNLGIYPYKRFVVDFRIKSFFITIPFLISYFLSLGLYGIWEAIIYNYPYNIFGIIAFSFLLSIVQHFYTRLYLFLTQKIPFKLVTFFNLLTKKRILEYQNGSWRFRHKLIQDYFASMDIDKFMNDKKL